MPDLLPVDVLEPTMRLDFIGSRSTQPIVLAGQKLTDEVDHIEGNRYLWRKIQVLIIPFDFEVNLLVILRRKWSITYEHLVDYNSQSPPIDHLSIASPP